MKLDSKSVIKELLASSHHVMMITGDNPLSPKSFQLLTLDLTFGLDFGLDLDLDFRLTIAIQRCI